MTVNILGTEYTIKTKKYAEEPYFKKAGCDGFCDAVLHEIVVCDLSTYPGYEDEMPDRIILEKKAILRHEIVHAFLNESGLQCNTNVTVGGWAKNEEMVDWIALQFPKMQKVFEQCGCEK